MRINEIINEGGIDMHLAPELLQQELDQLVELIKKGSYIMTPEDMYVFQQAKENGVFHPDEIDFKTHNRKLSAELKPELLRLRKVLKQSGDISHLVSYDMGNKHKELLKQQVRTDPEVERIYTHVRILLLKNACNGTWVRACYLDNHKWILDRENEKLNARQRTNYEKYRQDPEFVEKKNARSHANYEKYKQDPEWVKKSNAQQRAYIEKYKQDPEYVAKINAQMRAWREKMKQDPEFVEKGNAQARAYYEKMRQDPEWLEKKNAQSRAWQEKMRQDPEWVEKDKARARAYKEKYKQDPEWVEKKNAQARAYHNKMRQDPEWLEKRKAENRAYYNKNKST
jgi:hypothetical protein